MKKIVVGIIIGAILTFSGQALAETISNIGKKVSDEYSVSFEGKKTSDKAIEVDGSIYISSNTIDDNSGYSVRVNDDTVVIRKKFAKTGEPPLKDMK